MTTGRTEIDAAVAAARGVLADLQRQRAEAVARTEALAAERQRLAFGASTGDAAARKALAALTRDALTAGLDIENLDAAIAEAKRRITLAEHEAALEARRRAVAAAREKLIELREVGAAADAALHEFVTRFESVIRVGQEMRRYGVGMVGRDLLLANARRAVGSKLAALHLADAVAPSQRIELAALVQHWAEAIEERISLGENEEAA